MSKKKGHKKRRIIDLHAVAVVVAMILFFVIAAYNAVTKTMPRDGSIVYNELLEMINNGDVAAIGVVAGKDTMTVILKDGREVTAVNPRYDEFRKDMLEKGVHLITQEMSEFDALTAIISLVPTLALCGVFIIYFMRMMNITGRHSFQVLDNGGNVTFDDIAGMENIKDEVETAIETLVSAQKLPSVGARPVRGVLLEGEPGSGKTMIAKAIAGEAKVPFISAAGSDFVEMFIGVGAARIRNLWKIAELNAPCVIFIDEIDALGKNRTSQHEESNRTLNALLQKMDGLGTTSGILVIGETNLASELDPALLRSGRFDKKIHVPGARTREERRGIIDIHLKNKIVDKELDMDRVVSITNSLSGADIENVLNDAVLISLSNDGGGVIKFNFIEKAVLKLRTSGVESNTNYNDDDKKVVAVHEAGHAVVAKLLGRNVNFVSIKGYSSGVGGLTQTDLDSERLFRTKEEYLGDIKMLLGGMVAEEVINGVSTPGCSNDLEKATKLAKKIRFNWGMTDSLVSISGDMLSDDMRKEIDELLREQKDKTIEMVKENKDKIIELTDILIRDEVVYDYSVS